MVALCPIPLGHSPVVSMIYYESGYINLVLNMAVTWLKACWLFERQGCMLTLTPPPCTATLNPCRQTEPGEAWVELLQRPLYPRPLWTVLGLFYSPRKEASYTESCCCKLSFMPHINPHYCEVNPFPLEFFSGETNNIFISSTPTP